MKWTDDAVLLSVRKLKTTRLLIEAMTANHGCIRAIVPIDVKRFPMLLPGCFLNFECAQQDFGKPLTAALQSVDAGIIANDAEDIGLQLLSGARALILGTLGLQDPSPDVYATLKALLESLVVEDGRWPIHYAKFEFAIVQTLDLVRDVDSCRPDFRHGEAIYFSPRSLRAVTRERAGAFLDKMIPLPGILMGARNGNQADIRQALDLTGRLLSDHVFKSEKTSDVRALRQDLVSAACAVRDIPEHQEIGDYRSTIAARRARLLSERPLMVSKRAGGGRW